MQSEKGLDKAVRSPVDDGHAPFISKEGVGIHRAEGGDGPVAAAGHDHLRVSEERHHTLESLYASASSSGTNSHAYLVAKHGMRLSPLDGGAIHEHGLLYEAFHGRSQPAGINRRAKDDSIGSEQLGKAFIDYRVIFLVAPFTFVFTAQAAGFAAIAYISHRDQLCSEATLPAAIKHTGQHLIGIAFCSRASVECNDMHTHLQDQASNP